MIDEKIEELIAIGASVSANCQPCVKYHTEKAKSLGISSEEIGNALKIGAMVRGGAAGQMDKYLTTAAAKNGIQYKETAAVGQGCK